jgi:hypothetical protein
VLQTDIGDRTPVPTEKGVVEWVAREPLVSADAKQALSALHRELMDLNPSAARSLGEGMEETLGILEIRWNRPAA